MKGYLWEFKTCFVIKFITHMLSIIVRLLYFYKNSQPILRLPVSCKNLFLNKKKNKNNICM